MIVQLSKSPLGRVLIITVCYIVVTLSVFLLPSQSALPEENAIPTVAKGMKVWRESRCYVCHSLYGLGGHLGPDLTNVHSLRGSEYIRLYMITGRPGMPSYATMIEPDINALLAYLRHIDGTAEYPVKGSGIAPFGKIKKAGQ